MAAGRHEEGGRTGGVGGGVESAVGTGAVQFSHRSCRFFLCVDGRADDS